MNSTAILMMILAATGSSTAQRPGNQAATTLAPLEFLVGSWAGEVWRPSAAQGKKAFWYADIRYVLDRHILLFEERGSDTDDRALANRHVLALVSADSAGKDYRIELLVPSANGVTVFLGKAQVTGRRFTLQIDGSTEILRFVHDVDEQNNWRGVASRSRDNGATWRPVWELSLRRAK